MTTEDAVEIGRVNGYFARIGVAGIDLSKPLRVGDHIRIKGHTTDLEQLVDSIQIEHEAVQVAKAGDKIAIKVADRCRRGDRVFKVAD
jgi:translation elongation factor EF-1alpha